MALNLLRLKRSTSKGGRDRNNRKENKSRERRIEGSKDGKERIKLSLTIILMRQNKGTNVRERNNNNNRTDAFILNSHQVSLGMTQKVSGEIWGKAKVAS